MLRSTTTLAAFVAGMGLVAGSALALDEKANEKEQLKVCEKQLCGIITTKDAAGADFKCDVSKTWNKAKIKDSIEKKKLAWSMGDARCAITVDLKRSQIVEALTKPELMLEFPQHTIKCEVERENEVTPISITLAPKIQFKGGKAEKAWINLKDIEAPAVVKGAIWTAAKLEDTVGLFHADILSEVNDFVTKRCTN
jgi:hypothetical protein